MMRPPLQFNVSHCTSRSEDKILWDKTGGKGQEGWGQRKTQREVQMDERGVVVDGDMTESKGE